MVRPKSNIWLYFNKQDEKIAKCKKCFKSVRYCGNTSNLHKHMKTHPETEKISTKHNLSMRKQKEKDCEVGSSSTSNPPRVPQVDETDLSLVSMIQSGNLQPQSSSSEDLKGAFEKICSQKEGGAKYNNITLCILYFICKDMRPFHVVEGEGFLKLMKSVAPFYTVPSSTHFKMLLCNKYDIVKMEYIKRISNANDLCVTLDIWTETMHEKSFLGITAHFLEGISITSCNIATRELKTNHTADYISEVFVNVLNSWEIPPDKIKCSVTDNGSNMVAAMKRVIGETKHLPCFAHTINLVVECSLDIPSIKGPIKKVRDIVKWVKNSVINSDKLRKIQIDNGIPEGSIKKFILDVKTRWNSLFYMLERFLDMSRIASQLLLDATDSPEMVTGHEIEILKQLVHLLKPFEFVTKESSGQNYVTLSKIIPMVNCLVSQVKKMSSSIECVTELQTKLLAECNKRFGLIEFNTYAALGTLLDPRFKNLHFQDPNACGRAIQKLKNLVKEDLSSSASGSEEEVTKEDFDFWLHYKELAVGQKRKRHNTKGDEVSVYLSNPVCTEI